MHCATEWFPNINRLEHRILSKQVANKKVIKIENKLADD